MSPASAPASRPRPPIVRALAAVASLVLGAVVLAGCGSSHKIATSADPASAIPASAALYAGATVRPTGTQGTEALAAGSSLTHQANPYLRLLAALQTPGSPTLDYKRDVAPWLGPHAGVYLTSLSSAGPIAAVLQQGLLGGGSSGSGAFPLATGSAEGAIVLDTSDATKARAFLKSQAAHAGAHATSYRGVGYEATAKGLAFGIVDRFAVIGSEAGIHGVIDTTLGGSSLVHSSRLREAARRRAVGRARPHLLQPACGRGSRRRGEQGGSCTLPARVPAPPRGPSAGRIHRPRAGPICLRCWPGCAGQHLARPERNRACAVPSTRASSREPRARRPARLGRGRSASAPRNAGATPGLPSGARATSAGTPGGDVGALGELGRCPAVGPRRPGRRRDPDGDAQPRRPHQPTARAPLSARRQNARARQEFTSWMGSGGATRGRSGSPELRGAVVIESKNPARSQEAVGESSSAAGPSGRRHRNTPSPQTDAAVSVRVPRPAAMLAGRQDQSGGTKFGARVGEALRRGAPPARWPARPHGRPPRARSGRAQPERRLRRADFVGQRVTTPGDRGDRARVGQDLRQRRVFGQADGFQQPDERRHVEDDAGLSPSPSELAAAARAGELAIVLAGCSASVTDASPSPSTNFVPRSGPCRWRPRASAAGRGPSQDTAASVPGTEIFLPAHVVVGPQPAPPSSRQRPPASARGSSFRSPPPRAVPVARSRPRTRPLSPSSW